MDGQQQFRIEQAAFFVADDCLANRLQFLEFLGLLPIGSLELAAPGRNSLRSTDNITEEILTNRGPSIPVKDVVA